MFKVNIAGSDFLVKFRYSVKAIGKGNKKYNARFTDCIINGNIVGSARCSKHDNFCRNKGRVLSMQRALFNMKFDPDQRVLFWTKYFNKLRGD